MNKQLRNDITEAIARFPNDQLVVTISSVFMSGNEEWVKTLPARIRVTVDDELTEEVLAFCPEIMVKSVAGGVYVINETMIKHEIEQSIRVGLWRSLGIYNQSAGRALRPKSATPNLDGFQAAARMFRPDKKEWKAPCDHAECSGDGFHDENGQLKWVCRK